MKKTLIILVILAISLSALTLKERKNLMEKDPRELVNIISDYDKIINNQRKDIESLTEDINKLKIKKAFLRGRVFSMSSARVMIIIIIVIICIGVAVFLYLKFFCK